MKIKWIIAVFLVALSGFTISSKKKIKIFMAGDSTMSVKLKRAYPETGWGMPFAHFWDSTVTVINKAKNGRSTKTFISEGLWQSIYDEMSEGDYVFIQFGHNDEAKEKTERYTTPDEYKTNLVRFINDTRSKNAYPILITPVSRRRFKEGKQVETHVIYSGLVREVAASLQVPMIDLDKKSMELYQQMGEEHSKLLFLQLKPNEHPNYPQGKNDNTHFNELGARLIAQVVLEWIRQNEPSLYQHITKPVSK